jgi:RimJ/RimL family protein N-acetyltransferase
VRRVELRPFTRELLHLVDPWFDDAETQRWLGGAEWPRRMLDLGDRPLGEFRGAMETGRFRWLAYDGDRAIGYCDAGTFNRWTTWDGRQVIASLPAPCAGIAYVVDPSVRRRGYGVAVLAALVRAPEVVAIELFAAGVEPNNVASVACLRRAGFVALEPKPDFEGMIYYVMRRSLR